VAAKAARAAEASAAAAGQAIASAAAAQRSPFRPAQATSTPPSPILRTGDTSRGAARPSSAATSTEQTFPPGPPVSLFHAAAPALRHGGGSLAAPAAGFTAGLEGGLRPSDGDRWAALVVNGAQVTTTEIRPGDFVLF
jgi:hypothetical protein